MQRTKIQAQRKSHDVTRKITFLFVLGMMTFLTGCFQKQLPPIKVPIPETEFTTEEVSGAINSRMNSFRSLVGTGKVRIQSWEEKYKFSEAFVLGSPAQFRLETLGFLSQPVIFLTSDSSMLSLYSKKQNVFYEGIASQENLFRLSGINLSVENTILVLSGNPTRLASINIEWGMPLSEQGQYYLERISLSHNTLQRIWFDTTLAEISYFEEAMLTNGETILKVKFDNYLGEAGTYAIPALINIERPLDNTRVEIEYKELYDINEPVNQELFTFAPPEDAKIHYIDDQTIEQIERLAPYEEFRTKE